MAHTQDIVPYELSYCKRKDWGDLWIGAHAMALDVTLATNNEREFKRIAGLSVENWTK
jgi:predicted nucleic acid-binding protein